jgi:hypothetical protein
VKKRRATPVYLNPRRDCPDCQGAGWVVSKDAPVRIPEGAKASSYSPPLVRCRCTIPGVQTPAEPMPPAEVVDQARRASGEREEA